MPQQDTEALNALMPGIAGGDEGAFRTLYDRTAPQLLALLLRLLKSRPLAEDVLQETMVAAWSRAADFDPARAGVRTWLTTIARRRALDLLRSGTRRRAILRDDEHDIRQFLGFAGNEPALPESSDTDRRLAECLGRLQLEAAASIRYAYLDGLTFAEISAALERSIGTVKSWVRRGLGKLRECMQT